MLRTMAMQGSVDPLVLHVGGVQPAGAGGGGRREGGGERPGGG